MIISLAEKNIFIESIDQAYLNDYLKENITETKENENFSDAMKEFFFQIVLDMDLLRAE